MQLSLTVVLLVLRGLGACQNSNTTKGCDAACQAAFQAAFARESALWVSRDVASDPFYSVPATTNTTAPGDLLRWEDIKGTNLNANWTVPGGMSLSRFLYMSEDIDGSPIPASAFALLPYASPERLAAGPLRTVVWTHGTAGRVRNCAPTNHRALYYEWEGPFALAQAGYAVIAPDYAGLGSNIPQGFMYEAGFLHAADVAFGLIAARKSAISSLLGDGWVVIGHSEGGMTAWRTNERLAMPGQEDLLKAGKFLGAVAGAPALRPVDLIPESFRRANGGPVGDTVSIYLLQSLTRLFPNQIRIEDYISDIVAARLPLADQACLNTGLSLFTGLTLEQLYKNSSWITHPTFLDWQTRYNGAGPHALAAPMLVVQGLADILTYAENTQHDFNLTCSSFPESRAQMLLYTGLDHDVGFQAAQSDYLAWISDRFNAVEAPAGCSVETLTSVTDRFSRIHVSWASS